MAFASIAVVFAAGNDALPISVPKSNASVKFPLMSGT
jgi:hypothetical protein